MKPFATTQDVADRWRPLDRAELSLAGTLLRDASDMIRDRWPDVDARIESGALRASSVTRVAAAMVKRAIANADDGIESIGQTAGPFGQTVKYANPNGNLYLNADEVRLLDGTYDRKRAFAVDLSSGSLPDDYCRR